MKFITLENTLTAICIYTIGRVNFVILKCYSHRCNFLCDQVSHFKISPV